MNSFIESLKSKDRRFIGLVGCVAIAVLIAGAAKFSTMSFGDSTYTAELANSGGLRTGDSVQMAGVTVGRVSSLRLDGDKVKMTFEVDGKVHIGSQTRLEVELSTLLGGRYARLIPSANDAATDRIPLRNTSVPFDLPKTLELVGPSLEDLDGSKLRSAMSAMTKNLEAGAPELGATLDGLAGLSDVVTKRRGQFAELIDSADAVTKMVNENSAELFALMGQSDSLIKALLARRELVRSVIGQVRTLTGQLTAVLDENRPELQPLMEHLAGVSDILQRSDDALDRALELFPPASRYLNNMVGNGPYIDIYFQNLVLPDNLLCAAGVVKGCK